jgi:hypothetical protein
MLRKKGEGKETDHVCRKRSINRMLYENEKRSRKKGKKCFGKKIF